MAEDIDVIVKKIEAGTQEAKMQEAKGLQAKEFAEKATLKEKITQKKTEKQEDSVKEGVNITSHLSDIVTIAWNFVAEQRGLEKITDADKKTLDEVYAPLEEKYKIDVSPELNAVIGTGIVFAPKILKARAAKSQREAEGGVKDSREQDSKQESTDTSQYAMTGYPVSFGEHKAIKQPELKSNQFTEGVA